MENNIFELIRAVEQYNNEQIIRFTRTFPHNIGISQILVLSKLARKGPQMQSKLANELGYTPGAMTNIADKLLKEECAQREYDLEDRRIVMLAITEKGKRVLQEAIELGNKLGQEIFSVLTKEEIEQYLAIQKKLLQQFEK